MAPLRVAMSLALLALLLSSAPANADARTGSTTPELIERAVDAGELRRVEADLLLADALAGRPVPDAYRGDAPFEGTLVLLELRRRLDRMPPGEGRAELREALEPRAEAATVCEAFASPPNTHLTDHFYIEYPPVIGGGLTINDYAAALEAAWAAEVASFGWAAPPVAPTPAPGGRYHVQVQPLGPAYYGLVSSRGTHAGFVGNNPSTSWNEGDAYASCMVLNSDFDPFAGTPIAALQATAAHEYNHALQFGYGALSGTNIPDPIFIEGGATWMEDEVFDTANDNYGYLWPNFANDMGEYDTDRPYGYWITWRGMTEPYGTGISGGGEDVMQRFWEITSRNQGEGLQALDAALIAEGTSLAAAYHAYAVAVRFNRPCGGGYTLPYCLEEGPSYVAAKGPPPTHGSLGGIGSSFAGSIADNYALNWVSLPAGLPPFQVALQNTSRGGRFRASVACDTGTAIRVVPSTDVADGGEAAFVRRFEPSGCQQIFVVVTNVSQTAADPTTSAQRPYSLTVTPPARPSRTKLTTAVRGDEIEASGRVRPAQRGEKVDLTLFRKKGKRWDPVSSRDVKLKKGKRFTGTFRVPKATRCRVEAAFPGDRDHLPSSDARSFAC